jgi:Fe-S-cluster-containing hydrogenase component 2/CRP-like cAMP-binding protein
VAKEAILEAVLEGEKVAHEELAAIPGFGGISKEKHERFPGAIVRRTFNAGSNILTQGEHGTTAFYIVRGAADIFVGVPAARPPIGRRSRRTKGWFRNFGDFTNYLKGVHAGNKRRSQEAPDSKPSEPPTGKRIGEVGSGDIVGELEALNALKGQQQPRSSFYPRAATVRATSDVVVFEMLPNYLNGVLYPLAAFKDKLNRTYKTRAIEYTIRSTPAFRGLSEDLVTHLCSRAELKVFEADEVICRLGDEAQFFDLIRLGFVKLSQAFPGGELVLAYLSRNSYFGESGLLPVLRVRAQSEQGDQSVEALVSSAPIKVGRAASAPDDLMVPWDTYISRGGNVELRVEGNQLRVARGSAKNPIWFGGKHVDTALVSPGETFQLGKTTFSVESDPSISGKHPATATATDFVQIVRIQAEDCAKVLESSPEAATAIKELAHGIRQIALQVRNRVQQVSLGDFLDQDLMQAQNMLLLDLDRCTRCDECVKACTATHDDGVTRLIREGLRFENYLVTTSCRACMDPLCMTHCPVGAIRRKGASLDIVIEEWCIGCCNCAQDCPYGAINVVDLARPGIDPEPKPRAVVCDLCRDYAEPNCVRACPHDAAIRVQPNSFFSRDLAGVPLTVTSRSKTPRMALAGVTQIFTNADVLLRMIPRLEVVVPEGGKDQLPPGHTRSFPLQIGGSTSFGKEPESNKYVLQNDSVSGRQAVIDGDGKRFVLRNVSGSNVTLVNGREVLEGVELSDGDLIVMGEVTLRFLTIQMQ